MSLLSCFGLRILNVVDITMTELISNNINTLVVVHELTSRRREITTLPNAFVARSVSSLDDVIKSVLCGVLSIRSMMSLNPSLWGIEYQPYDIIEFVFCGVLSIGSMTSLNPSSLLFSFPFLAVTASLPPQLSAVGREKRMTYYQSKNRDPRCSLQKTPPFHRFPLSER